MILCYHLSNNECPTVSQHGPSSITAFLHFISSLAVGHASCFFFLPIPAPIDLPSKRSTLTSSLFFGLYQKNKGGRLVGAVWSLPPPAVNEPASRPPVVTVFLRYWGKKKYIKRINAAATANREARQLRQSSIHERQLEWKDSSVWQGSNSWVYVWMFTWPSCGADACLNETADFNH